MSVIIATRENGRDRSSVMVMYNVACQKQPGLGTHLEVVDLISSTSKTRKHTGSMKQLGEMKRQKSQQNEKRLGPLETPSETGFTFCLLPPAIFRASSYLIITIGF